MDRNSTPYSQMKVFCHQDVIQNLLEGKRCQPVYIRIKPTNKCNHNCVYCHYRHSYLDLDEYNPADEIPRDKMLEIVADMKEMGTRAVTFSGGGEPLLYPYIEETMQAVIDAGIDLSIITNGSLLSGKRAELLAKAKWVRISLESVRDDEYCKIRGIKQGSFDNLCKNIEAFARIKNNTCEFGVNMVVSRENHKDVYEMARLMKSLGVNHVKYAPVILNDTIGYHRDFVQFVTDELARASRDFDGDGFRVVNLYTGDFSNSVVFERQYSKCPIKEFICVIGANAKVYYCHDKAYLSDGVVCDLNKGRLKDLWFSEETDRKFAGFDAKAICKQHCVYDSRNEMINAFLATDRNHVNFI